jgi:hypothetical protein
VTTFAEDDLREAFGELLIGWSEGQLQDIGRRIEVLFDRFDETRNAAFMVDLENDDKQLLAHQKTCGDFLRQLDPDVQLPWDRPSRQRMDGIEFLREVALWGRLAKTHDRLNSDQSRGPQGVAGGLLAIVAPPGSEILEALIEVVKHHAFLIDEALKERRTRTSTTVKRPADRPRFRDFEDLVFGVGSIYQELTGRRPSFSENPALFERPRQLRSVFGSCMLRLIELFTRNLPEGWAELDKASDPMANPSMDSIRGAWERASKRH